MIYQLLTVLFLNLAGTSAFAYTANSVSLELRSNGRFRVSIDYTVPELKERRQVWVEFAKKADADAYYYDILRGADFYLPDAALRSFSNQRTQPDPW